MLFHILEIVIAKPYIEINYFSNCRQHRMYMKPLLHRPSAWCRHNRYGQTEAINTSLEFVSVLTVEFINGSKYQFITKLYKHYRIIEIFKLFPISPFASIRLVGLIEKVWKFGICEGIFMNSRSVAHL